MKCEVALNTRQSQLTCDSLQPVEILWPTLVIATGRNSKVAFVVRCTVADAFIDSGDHMTQKLAKFCDSFLAVFLYGHCPILQISAEGFVQIVGQLLLGDRFAVQVVDLTVVF